MLTEMRHSLDALKQAAAAAAASEAGGTQCAAMSVCAGRREESGRWRGR